MIVSTKYPSILNTTQRFKLTRMLDGYKDAWLISCVANASLAQHYELTLDGF